MTNAKTTIPTCVTCHAGSRDHYALSVALHEAKLLECLVTDFYTPDPLSDFYGKRRVAGLPSGKVVSVWQNALRRRLFRHAYDAADTELSVKGLKRALKSGSNLFFCSYTAFEAFSAIKAEKRDNLCLLFQLHPHPVSIKRILTDEIELVPQARDSIMSEIEMDPDSHVMQRLVEESRLADRCVVASSFTKETLVENGVAQERIRVVPYGVDAGRFTRKADYDLSGKALNLLFVGQMVQRKGLYYLLEAIKALGSDRVNLTIVGRGHIDHNLLAPYLAKYDIKVKINLSHEELLQEMHRNDCLVFPSLIEGFGHVILEAMSAGIPVICTPNTAGRDVFLSGHEGFVIPIRRMDLLAEKIEWCAGHKRDLKDMGLQAAETARQFTWDRFKNGIRDFYTEVTS
ncbi:glycosyltransferase family 4 protein [Geomonas subterranea]|uniref:Glycosyltransferase family 4 protein n=1 Tax=Geomonas subterranea TaxID=2847989 RepID=A0ABX8LIH9_9BACT|nr:glycosyltransferase family 4 protein [Geomonas subterranea]QXE91543.1 glycosyltransferase family 4 protein [Geomonas subterranea]QXM10368.1 glycosyltransferase family 4 protein [Geomonas subterranea]